MKIFATLCTSALLVNLAHSSLIVSNVVLAAYGKKTLVDSIAISGELYIGKKARLPRGSLDFRCSAVEFAAKQLPEAPEQISCGFIDSYNKPIPKYILSDFDNPSLSVTLESSLLRIDEKQQLNAPVSLSFTYQGFKLGQALPPEEYLAVLKPDLFSPFVHKTIVMSKPMAAESSAQV